LTSYLKTGNIIPENLSDNSISTQSGFVKPFGSGNDSKENGRTTKSNEGAKNFTKREK
jgi:hypothetical protein